MLALSARLAPALREGSNDLSIYRQAGEAVLRGEIPYRDFFIEYPPGSLPAFVPPALFSANEQHYISLFSSEMALALVATLVLTALASRRLRGQWVVPAVTFVAAALLLYPVAVTRYDAVVALALAVAVLCVALGGRYVLLAYAAIGLGATAKLIPALASVPLALARDRAARGYAVFLAVLALFFAPAILLGGSTLVGSLAYHVDRGLQMESFAASVLMNLGRVSDVVFAYGAFEVRGSGVGLAATLSLPVTGALLLLTALLAYREYRKGRLGPAAFPRYAAALILAFMLGSKVLSPQFVIWLLPLVPSSTGGATQVGVSAIFLCACLMTTQVYPTHYAELVNLMAPGPTLLLARNLLLALLWLLMLVLQGRDPVENAP